MSYLSSIANFIGSIPGRIGGVLGSIPGKLLGAFGFEHGGITGAAGGGPRGGLIMVGEHGRELIRAAPGSQVHSSPDTERMLAGAGGGQRTYNITVNVAPGGHPAETGRQLIELIREQERVSGKGWRS
jgi:hypothetical protein